MQHMANVTRLKERPEATAIEVAGLSHVYSGAEGGVAALEDISMEVVAGRFVVIVGPSGCGKTSLLMMLAGLRHQTEGTILCNGRPIQEPDPGRVGVVFQEASLFPWLSAADNVEFPLVLRGVSKDERRSRSEAMLRLVGLEGFGARYPHELSGGMKQRAAIARALLLQPKLLLMDEPFGALDALTREQMRIDLEALWLANRMTVVFITHSIDEAVLLADRVIVMTPRPGRVERILTIDMPRPRGLGARREAEFLEKSEEITDIFLSRGVLQRH
jgi:NitT/TauT family transport system ATP-binding protein